MHCMKTCQAELWIQATGSAYSSEVPHKSCDSGRKLYGKWALRLGG